MGSLVMSQVVSDLGRPPAPTMLHGGTHQSMVSESSTRPQQQEETPSGPYHTNSIPRFAHTQPTSNPNDPRSDDAAHVASSPNLAQQPPSPPMNPTSHPDSLSNASRPSYDARNSDQAGIPQTNNPPGLSTSSPSSPRLQPTFRSTRSLGGSEATSPSRIKVRDLSHIQSMASQEMLAPRSSHRPGHFLQEGLQYEISEMPVPQIIEMVAGLLTKITTTNDQQHEHLHRQIPHPEDAAGMSQQTTSVLAFHGKNVPSITILSYLSRIHKYCPTTYEVFLSLLVYFDRMTEMVNKGFIENMRRNEAGDRPHTSSSARSDDSTSHPAMPSADAAPMSPTDDSANPTSPMAPENQRSFSQFFVVDSYNIHRLVIAGVTCASKFFSDVFYTNSRYAKVRTF